MKVSGEPHSFSELWEEFLSRLFQILVPVRIPWLMAASLCSIHILPSLSSPPCAYLLRIHVIAFRAHLDNLGSSPPLNILDLITSLRIMNGPFLLLLFLCRA